MIKQRRWWLAAVAGVAVAAVAGIGAVMAQEDVPTPTTGTAFLDRVAGKLGIDSTVLRDAIKSSAGDEIDERLAAGDLTQEQADAAKERIAAAPDDALIGRGVGRGPGGPGFRHMFSEKSGLAEFLGITEEELRTQLQADGATLSSVAEANGKSRDELKAFLTSELQTRLDAAVAEGRITQEQADEKAAQHAADLDAVIDGTGGFGRGFHARGGGAPFGGDMPFDGAPAPDEDATPQAEQSLPIEG